jgi:hypothetical protein
LGEEFEVVEWDSEYSVDDLAQRVRDDISPAGLAVLSLT